MGRISSKPRLRPGERLTPRRWAAALEAIQARAEIAEAKFTGDTKASRLIRKAKAVLLPEAFNAFYLPHWFRSAPAPFHLELYRALETERRLAVRAPRGHAKSTVVTFAYTVHQVVCARVLKALQEGTLAKSDPELAEAIDAVALELGQPSTHWDPYIQIISSSTDQANEFVEAIALELQENGLLLSDWGQCWSEGEQSPYDWVSATDVRVRAAGMEGDIRGGKHRQWRPTLAIVDDPDSERTIATRKMRDRAERKLTAAVNFGLEPGQSRVIVIGTPLHSDCLVCRLTNEKRYPRWKKLRYKAIQNDGTALWPERWSLEALQAEEEEDPEAFGSEMMDRPPTEGNKPFPVLHTYSRAEYPQDLPKVLIFDPALGKSERSDYQAIVVLRGPVAGKILFHRCELLRIGNPAELIARVLEVVREEKPTLKIIETIGFQALLEYQLTDEAVRRGLTDAGWICIDHQAESKDLRIRGMAPMAARAELVFPDDRSCRRAEDQFLDYPDGKKDAVDATEMGIRVMKQGDDWGWTSSTPERDIDDAERGWR